MLACVLEVTLSDLGRVTFGVPILCVCWYVHLRAKIRKWCRMKLGDNAIPLTSARTEAHQALSPDSKLLCFRSVQTSQSGAGGACGEKITNGWPGSAIKRQKAASDWWTWESQKVHYLLCVKYSPFFFFTVSRSFCRNCLLFCCHCVSHPAVPQTIMLFLGDFLVILRPTCNCLQSHFF